MCCKRRYIYEAVISSSSGSILYLRVSTTGQVRTDLDPEGISLPAQRTACQRLAAERRLPVIAEYIEGGRSGRDIAHRPVLRQLLQRIDDRQDVSHVIVYDLSRLALQCFMICQRHIWLTVGYGRT